MLFCKILQVNTQLEAPGVAMPADPASSGVVVSVGFGVPNEFMSLIFCFLQSITAPHGSSADLVGSSQKRQEFSRVGRGTSRDEQSTRFILDNDES